MNWTPHGHCFSWNQTVLILYITGSVLTVMAYLSIPIVLLILRKNLTMWVGRWLMLSFACFILFCGAGHAVQLFNVWHTSYLLEAILLNLTGLSSVATLIFIIPVLRILLCEHLLSSKGKD